MAANGGPLMALSLFLAATHGSHHDLGPCPTDVGPMQHFDPVLFRGRWFEAMRYPSGNDTTDMDYNNNCQTIYNVPWNDTFYFGTVEGQRNGTEKLNTLKMWVGLEVVSEDPLQFNGTLTAYEDRDGTVFLQQNLVLDTDYDNYAIFYRCVTHVSNYEATLRQRWVRIFTKKMTPSNATAIIREAKQILRSKNIPHEILEEVKQGKDCIYPWTE